MILILAYLLGFLTAYLAIGGTSRSAWLTALSAMGLVVLRLIGGELLKPSTGKIFRSLQARLRQGTYFSHHFNQHPIFKYKDCHLCHETLTSASLSSQ